MTGNLATTDGMGFLLGLAIGFPLLLLAVFYLESGRRNAAFLLALAPAPAFLVAILGTGARFALPGPFRLTLALDGPGAMLMGVAALIWFAAALYAPAYWRGSGKLLRAAPWWLLTLAGSLGVFVAADLISFYLLYSLVSLAAFGLVILDGRSANRRAGAIYFGFAVLGEALLLMAFALLANAEPNGSLAIADVVATLPWSPWRDVTMLLILLGFGAKIASVPLHGWMPLSYDATPIPPAAALSGAAVKAGVIGLIRFLPFDIGSVGWGEALTVIGLVSTFWGVAVGLTQTKPKTILAYSSVSQMGVIATVLGMGLMNARTGVGAEAAFYAAHHILAKGGLFLAVGVVAATGRWRLWPVVVPAAIIALGIAGLPFTGGALAKLAVKDALGYGLVGWLAKLSAVASTVLMLHFLRQLFANAAAVGDQLAPSRLRAVFWATAAGAVLVPWLLWPTTGYGVADALSPSALWGGLWPVLIGVVMSVGFGRIRDRLPSVPPGDIGLAFVALGPMARATAVRMERAEAELSGWPVAGTIFLALALVIGLAMYFAGAA